MEMSSWDNWTNAAMLGASALIFLGDPNVIRGEFEQKNIPTPVAFPRFWATPETGAKLKDLALRKSFGSDHRLQNKVAEYAWSAIATAFCRERTRSSKPN